MHFPRFPTCPTRYWIPTACLVLVALLCMSSSNAATAEPSFILPHRGCYFASWAFWRTGKAKFLPRHIDPSLCTIIYYAFADIHLETSSSKATGTTAKPAFGFLTRPGASPFSNATISVWDNAAELKFVKRANPNIKLMLSIGGWGKGDEIAAIAASSDLRKFFIDSVISTTRAIDFDGLDLGWEYPARKDLAAATSLFTEIKSAIDVEAKHSGKQRLIFTAALCNTSIAGYNLTEMINALDLLNLMTYDLQTPAFNPSNTGHHSQLFPPRSNTTLPNVRDFVEAWEKAGASKSKIIVGLALYGDTWNLTSSQTGLGAPAQGAGPAGFYTKQRGVLSYYEICEKIRSGELIPKLDADIKTPYAAASNKKWWVSYEDETSIREKVKWVISKNYGGIFVWDVTLDDFFGACGGIKYPLLNAVKSEYHIQ